MINILDTKTIIQAGGYIGIFGIIFAETGLLVGFFLPGDSLLFTAGFLASTGYLNIAILLTGSVLTAIIGDSFGYFLGKKYGPRIFTRKESRIFKREYAEKAQKFYESHGGNAIILGRFIPVVRTAVPVLAGVGNMHYRRFFLFNIIGATLWAGGLSLFGYFFGKIIPSADKYVLPVIAAIVVISVAPTLIALLRARKRSKNKAI